LAIFDGAKPFQVGSTTPIALPRFEHPFLIVTADELAASPTVVVIEHEDHLAVALAVGAAASRIATSSIDPGDAADGQLLFPSHSTKDLASLFLQGFQLLDEVFS
jgi:hypothetical protein